jgi:lipopolysaccharide export system protein LptA
LRTSIAALAAALLAAGTAGAFAQSGDGGRMTNMRLTSDQPIQIESDRLEVRDNDRLAVFEGNVSVVQGATRLRSGTMTVHYAAGSGGTTGAAGSSDIERIEVGGGVHVSTDAQVATGDRATFDMASETLVVTGREVVLTEGSNVIMGCRLTVQMASGLAKLDGCGGSGEGSGRVRMLLQPGSANR